MIAKVRSSATKRFLQTQQGRAEARPLQFNKPYLRLRSGKLHRLKPLLPNLFQSGGDGGAEFRGSLYGADARCCHGRVFIFRCALTSADDGARVAHAASWRRSLAGDETDNRLFHAGPDPCRGLFLGVAADFTDQNDGARIGIVVKKLDGIEEGRADDGVAADADAGGLADAEKR